MIILQIFIYLLLFLISILILLLAMPIYYTLSGIKEDMVIIKAQIFGPLKWICLTFKMRDMTEKKLGVRFLGIPIKIKDNKKDAPIGSKVKRNNKGKKTRENGRKPAEGIPAGIVNLIVRALRHIKPRRLEVKGRYGFNDPYHTGIACSLINTIIPHKDKYNVNLIPVFDEEVIEGKFITEGYIVPVYLFWLFIKVFVLSRLKKAFNKSFRGRFKRSVPAQ